MGRIPYLTREPRTGKVCFGPRKCSNKEKEHDYLQINEGYYQDFGYSEALQALLWVGVGKSERN
jgi:hypothetical protein